MLSISKSKTKRLETLEEFDILDKDIQEELSGLIDLASEICEAPFLRSIFWMITRNTPKPSLVLMFLICRKRTRSANTL
ncbi:hypothetical protein [Fodinibius sp. SL11]|uniref:hypothetical protein n=1 Tax=Fodinibius sp. SL11 TaxID=3425690 RepID=UPI003F883667